MLYLCVFDFHCRVQQKSVPLDPILSHLCPYLLKIHFDIILLSTPSSQVFGYNFIFFNRLSLLICATCSNHLILLDLIILITFGEGLQIKEFSETCAFRNPNDNIFILLNKLKQYLQVTHILSKIKGKVVPLLF